MSRSRRRIIRALKAAALLAVFCGGSAPSVVLAEDNAPASAAAADPVAVELDLMGKRLRRGTANAGLGWLEIPAGVQEIGNQHGIGAAATWGLVHGSGRAVQRTAVGLFEILTFPFKLTQNNKPIIEPEFVLDKPKAEAPAPAPAEAPSSS
jgi:putative exosortase-associated protein (TIGR04073 family)